MTHRSTLFIIAALFISCLVVLALILGRGFSPERSHPPRPEATPLSVDVQSTSASEPGEYPPWLLAVVVSFLALQLLPLLYAAKRARRGDLLSKRQKREVEFLCETPMYLGLLGSLVGVCLTQFLTGSVAAPLAYLTTITGILLYLYAKLAIAIPLGAPEENDL